MTRRGWIITTVLLGSCTTVLACPVCHTETGLLVRAGIFHDHFLWRLLQVALPFPVFAGLLVGVHFDMPVHAILGTVRDRVSR